MALEHMDGPVDRKAFLDTVWQTGSFDLGGVGLRYDPQCNRGMQDVFLTDTTQSAAEVEQASANVAGQARDLRKAVDKFLTEVAAA